MYTVYVLQDNQDSLYKGMTNNFQRRFSEHKSGKTKTTRKMNDLKLVYEEKFESFVEARERELYLKTAAGRRFLRNKIRTHSSVG